MGNDTYNKDFFQTQQNGSKRSALHIIPIIQKLVEPKTVLDVGCGTGTWLSVFKELGTEEIVGVDGHYVDLDMLQIPKEDYISQDLTTEFNLDRQFDLVVSLEVAEHLPENHAESFVQTLINHSSVILFSAAIPYQGGKNHVNEQWPEYWANLFIKHGYVPIDCLRNQIWDNPEVQWWYAQNIIIFVKRDQLDRYPLLKEELALNAVPLGSLSRVHPQLYMLLAKDFFGEDGYKDGFIIGRDFTPRI